MSDSLQPHGLYSPWDSPGQDTGVGSHSFLQGIFPAQGLNPGLPHCRWILYQLNHAGSPRTLEWVAYPFSTDLPNPGIEPESPALQAESLPTALCSQATLSDPPCLCACSLTVPSLPQSVFVFPKCLETRGNFTVSRGQYHGSQCTVCLKCVNSPLVQIPVPYLLVVILSGVTDSNLSLYISEVSIHQSTHLK